MTDQDKITALRAALEAGPTPGPWTWQRYKRDTLGEYRRASDYLRAGDGAARKYVLVHERLYRPDDESALLTDADAAFVAAARDGVPALLAENEALREALQEMALAFHIFNGRCTTDLPHCTTDLCVSARALLAAHPADEEARNE